MSRLIVVSGLPGSGKTMFAVELAESLSAVHLNTDQLRHAVGRQGHYSDAEKADIYMQLFTQARVHLKSALDVILDGTFYKQSLREICSTMAAELQVPLYWIEITAPEDVIRERIARKRPYTEADYNVYLHIKSEYEALPVDRLVLDSAALSLHEMIQQARAYLTVD